MPVATPPVVVLVVVGRLGGAIPGVTAVDEFEVGKVTALVEDAETFGKNELIGLYDIDMAFVYSMPGHEVYKKWLRADRYERRMA